MGMYTHVRGWMQLKHHYTVLAEELEKKFNDAMQKAERLSPRSRACVACTVFHYGCNGCPYIFIGGEMKDYDNDWDIFLHFLASEFDIRAYSLEMKYEEWDEWQKIGLDIQEGQKQTRRVA